MAVGMATMMAAMMVELKAGPKGSLLAAAKVASRADQWVSSMDGAMADGRWLMGWMESGL